MFNFSSTMAWYMKLICEGRKEGTEKNICNDVRSLCLFPALTCACYTPCTWASQILQDMERKLAHGSATIFEDRDQNSPEQHGYLDQLYCQTLALTERTCLNERGRREITDDCGQYLLTPTSMHIHTHVLIHIQTTYTLTECLAQLLLVNTERNVCWDSLPSKVVCLFCLGQTISGKRDCRRHM